MTNVAIFVSGNGTNCENIIQYFKDSPKVNIALVLSNKEEAYALARARKHGVPTSVFDRKALNDKVAVLALMKQYDIDFIVLAGFLLMVPGFLLDAYKGRIINLHPALLPKFGGKGMYGHHVHEAVKAAGEHQTGMTVHWVSNVCDGGEIIRQYSIPILPGDTPDDIAAKEHVLEMRYFPKVIEEVIDNL